MDKAEILFESYNMVVARKFSTMFEENNLGVEEEELHEQLKEGFKAWEEVPIEQLDNLTPTQYFANVVSFDESIELFKIGAIVCDWDIPDLLVKKLQSFGDASCGALIKLASDKEVIESEKELFISLTAIRVLGLWRRAEAVDAILGVLGKCEKNLPIFAEEIVKALVKIGKPAIESVLDMLESAMEDTDVYEHLLDIASRLGRTNKSDRIYKDLKRAFQQMDNKVFAAICLAEYGDGRAIPVLRGYIEKNRNTIDKETFFEIKATVEQLGGNMDDVEPV